jgi:hypothetical protein
MAPPKKTALIRPVHDLEGREAEPEPGDVVERGHRRGGDEREPRRGDRGRVGDDHERGEHDEGREDARHREVGHRVVGQRLERVDLLGDAHRPDLRRHARAHAPAQHERREERAQLEHDAAAHEQPEHRELHAGEELVVRPGTR